MNVRQFLPAVLFVAAIVALVWMAWGGTPVVALEPVVEGPRPPVVADPATRPLVLRGLMDRFRAQGNELRQQRNEMARRHREAVEAWRAGRLPLRKVEELEQLLWVARFRVGEIGAQVLHAKLAELFGREVERLEQLAQAGRAGRDDLELARVYTARELHLAGKLPARDYAQTRRAYLDAFRRRNELLIEVGRVDREQFQLEWQTLINEFPEPDTAG